MEKHKSTEVVQAQHVFITVAGGVAYVAQAPESVEVHIIDYDDLKADFDETFSRFSPEEQAFYWRMEQTGSGSSSVERG